MGVNYPSNSPQFISNPNPNSDYHGIRAIPPLIIIIIKSRHWPRSQIPTSTPALALASQIPTSSSPIALASQIPTPSPPSPLRQQIMTTSSTLTLKSDHDLRSQRCLHQQISTTSSTSTAKCSQMWPRVPTLLLSFDNSSSPSTILLLFRQFFFFLSLLN